MGKPNEFGYIDCVSCDSTDCIDFEIPECESDAFYRPVTGKVNEKGYIDCVECDNVKCPTFEIPECTDAEYRPRKGKRNDAGYIPCEMIPECAQWNSMED